jgi:hypothetical protein
MYFETIGAYHQQSLGSKGAICVPGFCPFLAIITRIAAAVEKRVEIRFVPKPAGCSGFDRIRAIYSLCLSSTNCQSFSTRPSCVSSNLRVHFESPPD